MKLIIPDSIGSIDKISCTSLQCWVPPLPHMKGPINVMRIIKPGSRLKVSVKLDELFRPINCYCDAKRNESILPKQGTRKQNVYTQHKIDQRKAVSPNKLQCSLYSVPDWFDWVHRLLPHICCQHITNFIKKCFQN